ncbi:hypothetical protein SEET0821_06918 [Salmonella enterica subsp. enterica serovar Tennessee str. TXSC_TXSC08-21]|nr:hypothetical protein SEET0821_06918 [Salmonella enterica subsp. enterica serovar Tennessee str. TXSC_TXSC08-21]
MGTAGQRQQVFPAPAGINRTNKQIFAISLRVPRASGDKPQMKNGLKEVCKCSPRQRG